MLNNFTEWHFFPFPKAIPGRGAPHEGAGDPDPAGDPDDEHPHAPLHPQVQPHHARLPPRRQLCCKVLQGPLVGIYLSPPDLELFE